MKKMNNLKKAIALAMSVVLLLPVSVSHAATQTEELEAKVYEKQADVVIASARDLEEFAQKVNNGNDYSGKLVRVVSDIVFDGNINNFTPIGTMGEGYTNGFAGTFDGGGHVISGINVTITKVGKEVGLFGYVETSGIVKNVTIENSEFVNVDNVGGIACENSGKIINCHVWNTSIDGKSTTTAPYMHAGGIVGYNNSTASIVNCSFTGTINSTCAISAGGIAGENTGSILNCCNRGNINAENTRVVGGVTGGTRFGTDTKSVVENCYNVGNITCSSITENVGGIVGSTAGIVANSYCSEESAEVNISNMTGVEKNNKSLPASEMQTEKFVEQLNGNIGSNAEWMKWEIRAEESAYPIHKKLVSVAQCTVMLSNKSVEYDGKTKKVEVKVSYEGKELTEGVDYSIFYENNVNVGTAYIYVMGEGAYKGVVEETFTIEKGQEPSVDQSNPQQSETQTPSSEQTNTQQPGTQTPSSEQTNPQQSETQTSTTEQTNTTGNQPVVGSIVSLANGQYKIIKSDESAKEVTYVTAIENKKKSVTIPDVISIEGNTYKVTEISDKAFKNNKKLQSVTIGKNVKKIGKEAFCNCKKLKKITIKSKVLKSVGKNAIKGINKKATIKVPKKQYTAYKKLFKNKTGYKKTMKIAK